MAQTVNLKAKYAQYEAYTEDIIHNLKDLMEEALKMKDKDQVTKYQEQIWALKDFKAGYLKNINEKVLKEAFDLYKTSIEQAAKSSTKNLSEREKKLRSLIKKRDQIKLLIERQVKGEKLEKNQMDKISTLESIEEEIEMLEK